MSLKTLPTELVGRLISFSIISRLATEPGHLGGRIIVMPGDVAIIVDVALSRQKWTAAYTEPTVWYRVQTPLGDGWFDSLVASWRLLPDG